MLRNLVRHNFLDANLNAFWSEGCRKHGRGSPHKKCLTQSPLIYP